MLVVNETVFPLKLTKIITFLVWAMSLGTSFDQTWIS